MRLSKHRGKTRAAFEVGTMTLIIGALWSVATYPPKFIESQGSSRAPE
jgi:hypothetical protein